jgi:hypothetical protein
LFEKVFLHGMVNKRVPLKKTKSEDFLDKTHIADELFNASAELIDKLEVGKTKTRGTSAETRLQLGLYCLYIDITGKDGLSDGGPAYWFVKTFAAEIDESVDVPEKGFAVLVRKARNRDRDRLDEARQGQARRGVKIPH